MLTQKLQTCNFHFPPLSCFTDITRVSSDHYPKFKLHLSTLGRIAQLSNFLLTFGYSQRSQDQTTTTWCGHLPSATIYCLYFSCWVHCASFSQSPMPTAAWWVVQSTALSWLKTTPNCGLCCSLCATITEVTSTAPTPDDPARTPSYCSMGKSARTTFVRILFLVRLLCLGGGGEERVESMLHWFDSFTVFNARTHTCTRAHTPTRTHTS